MCLPQFCPARDPYTSEFRLNLSPPALPGMVGPIRRFLRDLLHAMGLDPDSACLILSELVTNALVHGEGRPGVTLELVCGELHITVSDAAGNPLQRPVRDDSRASGRGLDIVEALSDEWGVELIGSYGKAVWAVAKLGPPAMRVSPQPRESRSSRRDLAAGHSSASIEK
ncbi:ATP-binding protein [Kitasatospora aureofaciens]|uniref:ATP-binding protein n=1 Tax=Kitasatospora aureofaciens TaxID=1894 RepID=UPI00131B5CE4|nr:ATP-binding protein [Kitasatospora aureofaciens]HJD81827.1 ATP-binding protein [Kitasatospora aureofaciens]